MIILSYYLYETLICLELKWFTRALGPVRRRIALRTGAFQEAAIDTGGKPMESNDPKPPSLAELSETQRAQAMARFAVLRPHLEQEVPLQRVAGDAGIPVRISSIPTLFRRWEGTNERLRQAFSSG